MAVYDAWPGARSERNSRGVDPLRERGPDVTLSCNQMPRPASKERMKTWRYEIRESEVTPEALFLRRREFLRAAAAVSLVAAGCVPGDEREAKGTAAPAQAPLADVKPDARRPVPCHG